MGMRRLSSTALTAYLVLDWLLKTADEQRLDLPLGTVRLLLSPNVDEIAATNTLARESRLALPSLESLQVPHCSLEALRACADAWRRSSKVHRAGATFFYFAGHGIQRHRGDQLLLMDTFGSRGPIGQHTATMSSLFNGMAPYRGTGDPETSRPDIARTQFYFVDACRSAPPALRPFERVTAGDVFDIESPDMTDDRRAPIFYAAVPAGMAQAVPGQQTLFSIALLRCLKGEAAEAPDTSTSGRKSTHWHVSSFSLNKGLPRRLEEVNAEFGGVQIGLADGFSDEAVLCYLDGPPDVPFQLAVEPEHALSGTHVRICNLLDPGNSREFHVPADRYPFRWNLKAGFYQFSAALDAPNPPFRDCPAQPWLVEPLRPRIWKARMSDAT
jgi:hypothetical protein